MEYIPNLKPYTPGPWVRGLQIAGVVLVLILGGVTLDILGGAASRETARELDLARAWKAWEQAHCRLLNVSSGGVFGGHVVAAYRCDDDHDYIFDFDELAPKDWQPR